MVSVREWTDTWKTIVGEGEREKGGERTDRRGRTGRERGGERRNSHQIFIVYAAREGNL